MCGLTTTPVAEPRLLPICSYNERSGRRLWQRCTKPGVLLKRRYTLQHGSGANDPQLLRLSGRGGRHAQCRGRILRRTIHECDIQSQMSTPGPLHAKQLDALHGPVVGPKPKVLSCGSQQHCSNSGTHGQIGGSTALRCCLLRSSLVYSCIEVRGSQFPSLKGLVAHSSSRPWWSCRLNAHDHR